jgi:hypothetical protein
MQDTLHLVAIAAVFPLMAVALSLPFYLASWLRAARQPRAFELSSSLASA